MEADHSDNGKAIAEELVAHIDKQATAVPTPSPTPGPTPNDKGSSPVPTTAEASTAGTPGLQLSGLDTFGDAGQADPVADDRAVIQPGVPSVPLPAPTLSVTQSVSLPAPRSTRSRMKPVSSEVIPAEDTGNWTFDAGFYLLNAWKDYADIGKRIVDLWKGFEKVLGYPIEKVRFELLLHTLHLN